MKIFLVTFMASEPLQQTIIDVIKRNSAWARISQTAYCIKRDNMNAAEVRDSISSNLEGEFRLFVVDITNSYWGSYGLPVEVTNWLKEQ